MADEEYPTCRLLQPELLTKKELCAILGRHLVTLDLSKTKEQLLEIYNRVALPLPQRTYGSSTWRERLLEKKQARRKININIPEPHSGFKSSSKMISNNNETTTTHQANNRDRLKPPPLSTESREKRIVRISSSKPQSVEPAESTESNESKTENPSKHKRIRIDFSDSSEKSTPSPKVVKRTTENESTSPRTPKHRRIVI